MVRHSIPIRRLCLLPCLCLLSLLPACPAEGASTDADPDAPPPRGRSVLLIVADDLGRDYLGCYGNNVVRTPHLDALAGRGTRFTRAFAAVASCSPSRAVLLTGLHTHANGQYGLAHAAHNQHTLGRVRSLPAVLNRAGYHTGVVGKLHVQPPAVYPFTADLTKLDARGPRPMAERVTSFLSETGDRPFFLLVGFTDPHRAGTAFDNDRPHPGDEEPVDYDPADLDPPYFLPDQPEVRRELADYARSVTRLDRGVGEVLAALKASGRAADTLVIFLSDNGIPFPGAKTTLYDPGIHLPLIIAAPDPRRRGITCDAMVSWTDIAPTILDWAGATPDPRSSPAAPAPPPLPGRSVLPILEQDAPAGWDEVYGSHQFHEVTMYYPMRMVRTRRHKLILNLAHGLDYPFASDLWESPTWQGVLRRKDTTTGRRRVAEFVRRPRLELYDLEKDPEELHNLADDPAHRDVLNDLSARLRKWREATNDPWVVKYTHE